MQQNQRTKMCPNCEGNVALEVSICPYCGSSVFNQNDNLANKKIEEDVKSLSYEETLASLYPPPYKPNIIEEPQEELKQALKEELIEEESVLLPTIFFWLGVNILVFSLILLLFSKEGVLHLKWNANYWFLYSLFSLPLLFFGIKGLKNLN